MANNRILYVSVGTPEETSYLNVLKSRANREYLVVGNCYRAKEKISKGGIDRVVIATVNIPSVKYALDHNSKHGLEVLRAAKEKSLPAIVLSKNPSSLEKEILNSATEIINTSDMHITKKLLKL